MNTDYNWHLTRTEPMSKYERALSKKGTLFFSVLEVAMAEDGTVLPMSAFKKEPKEETYMTPEEVKKALEELDGNL